MSDPRHLSVRGYAKILGGWVPELTPPPPGWVSKTLPPILEHDARIAIRSFLAAVYEIELQWEMHSEITTWGEGHVDCINYRVRLTRKGTALHHGDVPEECHRWLDVASSNAKLVWRSFFPSLLQICLWYATNGEDIWRNVASVIVSLVHKRYPID